jgi:transcriptional regulator with XRE-family HTH domain
MKVNIAEIEWPKFGDLIRGRRAEKRLSQSDVARELGISQPAVSMIERGSPTGLSDDRLLILLSLLEIAEEDVPTAKQPKPEEGRSLFISYSHTDKEYLDRLLVHLRPLQKSGLIDPWNDTRIVAGDKWKEEIEKALEKAAVAVLLISADFLASNFIVDNELPPLLKKASDEGTVILPLILKPCGFIRDKSLSIFQAVNSPDAPLSGMDEHVPLT